MIRKYILHISIFYTFVGVYFIVWHVVCLRIYFMGACVFYYCWVPYSINMLLERFLEFPFDLSIMV